MPSTDDILAQIRRNPHGVRFAELRKICEHYFGAPRNQETSHLVFKTPWAGDPRVNIQNDHGKAKAYQIKQVLAAIDRLEESQNEQSR